MLIIARESDGDVPTTRAEIDINEATQQEEMRLEFGPLAFIVSLDRAHEAMEQIRTKLIDVGYFAPPLNKAG